MKASISIPWVLAIIVAMTTLVASVGVSISTVNMPGQSPSLKDAANITALVFCIVSLGGGGAASMIVGADRAKRRVVAWWTLNVTVVGAITTTILMVLATT